MSLRNGCPAVLSRSTGRYANPCDCYFLKDSHERSAGGAAQDVAAKAVKQTRGVLAYFRRQGVEPDADRETNEARSNLRKRRTTDQDSLRRIDGAATAVAVMKAPEFRHMMLSGMDPVTRLPKDR
ncbi:hypothetical protein P3T43_000447 [Paraburkholderia sp. GAS41]|uniref:hypothetical protein n=1 Tax=Paraburkholderia sp. GAS41 TaxID=3035134 RepID=UPI003D1C8116